MDTKYPINKVLFVLDISAILDIKKADITIKSIGCEYNIKDPAMANKQAKVTRIILIFEFVSNICDRVPQNAMM